MKKISSTYKRYALSVLLGASFFTFSVNALSEDKLITNLEKTSGVSKNASIPENKAPEAAPAEPTGGIFGGTTKKLHTHSLILGLGQTILYGDFSDLGEDEITADVYYVYKASHSFDFLANFHYSNHELGRYSVDIPGMALGIRGRFYQFDSFAPFLIGGLGFYMPTVEREVDGVIVSSDDKVTLGSHFGFGADLDLNDHVTVGILFHYHNPFDIKQDTSKGGQVEGSYGKLLLTAGYTF